MYENGFTVLSAGKAVKSIPYSSKRRTVRAVDTAELYGTFRTTRYFSYRQVLPPIP